MKKRFIVLFFYPLAILAQDPSSDPLDVHIVNNNNHHIEVHNERKDVCDCTPFFGEQFKMCMNYVSKECFTKNLQSIDPRICRKYVLDLTMKEIEELRASFSPEQWQDLQRDCNLFTMLVEERIEIQRKKKEAHDRDTNRSLVLGLLALALFALK